MTNILTKLQTMDEVQLKELIEESSIARLIGRPGLLKATGRQQRIIEAYYMALAETDDEMFALRAAREAAY